MKTGMRLVTAPTIEPVGLEAAKHFMRVEVDDDDDLIDDLITQARDLIEDKAKICFLPQTWEQVMDTFPYMSDPIDLMRWPIRSITSVSYLDADNQSHTWAATNYTVNKNSHPPRIAPVFSQFWPIATLQTLANVTIVFSAGFDDAEHVPPRLKHHLLRAIAYLYEHRDESEGQLSALPDEVTAAFMPPMVA